MKTILLILLLAIAAQAQAVIIAPTLDVSPKSTFTVPIEIVDADGMLAFEFNLAFDTRVAVPIGENFGCSTEGTIAELFSVNCNVESFNTLRVSAYGAMPLHEDGVVLNATFAARNKARCGDLIFGNVGVFILGTGAIKNEAENGLVCVVR